MNIQLSELADIKLGYSFREAIASEENGDIGVVTAKNIDKESIELGGVVKIKDRQLKSKHFLQNGDIVINTRLNFKSGIYKDTYSIKTIVASPLIIIRVYSSKISPEYLNIYLNLDIAQQNLKATADTGVIPFLSLGQIKGIDVFVPNIEKQRKVIEFDLLRKKEAAINQQVAHLKSQINKKVISSLIYE